ncbi:transcription termination factor 5, mitochondrial [Euwallacea fornicatus]|uniref:transcription termination factor 5, mitochondrial n=1 Tax=Euwallacea fornicatus TaxID=995702 RepID=UPI00338F4002
MFKRLSFHYPNLNFINVAHRTSYNENYKETNFQILAKACGFSGAEIYGLFKKHSSFYKIEPAVLAESIKFCHKLGFSKQDLIQHSNLLISHPVTKINHYNSLLDSGCTHIDAHLLCRALKYFKSSIQIFKLSGYLNSDANVADSLLSHVKPPIEKPKSLCVSLKVLDAKLWTDIHREILVAWLKIRLQATDDEIAKLLRIHQMIKNKSFRSINENITLAEDIGLSRDKILKCGYLLNNYPEYPKIMMQQHPFFAGLDIVKSYKSNPKMMMVNPRKILEIYNILKEYNVTDEQIQCKPDVFTMSSVTLRERLNYIPEVPEFRLLLTHPRMLKLVVHHHKIKNRLDFIRSAKIRCASFKTIGNLADERFEHFIREGKDYNHPKDVLVFFSQLLKKPCEDLKPKLFSHPYHAYVPLLDIESTYFLLTDMGYLVENLARCPQILLYPRDKVQKKLKNVLNDVRLRSSSQYTQIKLALYYIEKEFHFTGDGIWRTDVV